MVNVILGIFINCMIQDLNKITRDTLPYVVYTNLYYRVSKLNVFYRILIMYRENNSRNARMVV